MNKEQFFGAVVEAVENEIPPILRGVIEVGVREVIKTNDEVLHGISIMLPESTCAPTIYLEECFKDYQNGQSIEEIAKSIIDISIEAYQNAPTIEEIPLDYDNVEDKLIVQMVDGDLNKERLKELVYKPVGNGFVMIPYIVIKEDYEGSMRAAVTKTMAKDFEYDIDNLLDTAFLNTIEKNEPIFMGMTQMMSLETFSETANPLSPDYKLNPQLGMYVLTNDSRSNGASALFYPEMNKRIGELLSNNYYVLPSSQHEVIIVPEGTGPTLNELKEMVKVANRTVVDPQDILSDKVLFYDRERDRLIEPKVKERDGSERGDR